MAPMQLLSLVASPLGARQDDVARMLATRVAHGRQTPTAPLLARAAAVRQVAVCPAGRIESGGTWTNSDAHALLSRALGSTLAPALRTGFEWYLCRGAFFHNDAHYGNVLFGVWCIEGPPVDLVLPRAQVRVPLAPGAIAVFDPFEIHGVLHRGAAQWQAEDYESEEVSVFLGFELELDAGVRAEFGVADGVDGPMISSRTRVSATSGTFDSPPLD